MLYNLVCNNYMDVDEKTCCKTDFILTEAEKHVMMALFVKRYIKNSIPDYGKLLIIVIRYFFTKQFRPISNQPNT